MVLPEQAPRIAIFTAMFPPAYLGGGPIRTLDALVRTVPSNLETAVITGDTDLGQSERLDVDSDRWLEYPGGGHVYYTSQSLRARWRAMREVRAFKPEVVYLNSFFGFWFSIIPQLLAKAGYFGSVTLLIAPRGEFSSSARALKNRKKVVYMAMYRLTQMHRRVTWHASSANESQDIRKVIGASADVIIKEDDTELEPVARFDSTKRLPGPLRAITVARLVPIKRVDMLLTALAAVKAPLVLDVVGPHEDVGYAERCLELCRRLPAHIDVRFRGHVPHDEIQRLIAQHDVMVMPTASENFGHVVAESLSAACPVICADSTPWTSRLRAGGGQIVEPDDLAQWTNTIEHYAKLDDESLNHRRLKASQTFEAWQASNRQVPHLFEVLRSRSIIGG